jgi:cytochrome c
MLRIGLIGFALLAAIVSLAQTAPPDGAKDSGKDLFDRRCAGCHAVDRDKEGPRLQGVYGRTAGSVDSFQYSEALKKSKITWDADSLEKWLADPASLVPNNDMTYHVEKAGERRAIIAYLKEISGK